MQANRWSKTLGGLVAGVAGLAAWPAAHAAQKSSLPNFPPGLTLGTPAGVLPAQPGAYWIEKNFYTSIDPVDGHGHKTGAHLDSYATVAIFQVVPGWHLLGADYAFQLDSYGYFHARIDFPHASGLPSYSTNGTSDLAIRPLILSWHLSPHLGLAIREGVYIPTGSYDAAKPLSISHHRRTFEQGIALSYVSPDWILSANGVVDVNGSNGDTLVDGRHERYRSGSSYDLDLTALRHDGRWQYGLVGYYYHQFSPDHGPADLDGGVPSEGALGPLVGYQLGRVSLQLSDVRDVYARNVGKQSRVWLSVGLRL